MNLALYKRSFKKILLFFTFWCESETRTPPDHTLMAVMECVCNGAMQHTSYLFKQWGVLMLRRPLSCFCSTPSPGHKDPGSFLSFCFAKVRLNSTVTCVSKSEEGHERLFAVI